MGLNRLSGMKKYTMQKWLNATVKMPAVQKDIDAILDKISQELATIETLKSEDETNSKRFITIHFRLQRLSEQTNVERQSGSGL